MTDAPRHTRLAHGAACSCKRDPAILHRLLAEQPAAGPFARLLVGNETSDDAVRERVDGTCRRDAVRRNADALAGDAVILTKALGAGVCAAAFERAALDTAGDRDFVVAG